MDQAAFSCVSCPAGRDTLLPWTRTRMPPPRLGEKRRDHRFDEICVTCSDSPEPFGPPDSVSQMFHGSV